jgi:transposase-like protein
VKRNGTPQNATPESLTPAQDTAIVALLAGKTITDAATAAGVDRATVHRWLKDDLAFLAA